MVGIKVLKKGSGTLYAVHVLADEGRTACGRNPADLDVVERFDHLAKLPAIDACLSCARTIDGWYKPPLEKIGGTRYLHPGAAPGRMRKTGSLSHGTRISRGSRIG